MLTYVRCLRVFGTRLFHIPPVQFEAERSFISFPRECQIETEVYFSLPNPQRVAYLSLHTALSNAGASNISQFMQVITPGRHKDDILLRLL